jgi:hypothetical protein
LDQAGAIGENAARLIAAPSFQVPDMIQSVQDKKNKVGNMWNKYFNKPPQPPPIIMSYPTNGSKSFYMGTNVPVGYSTNVPVVTPAVINTNQGLIDANWPRVYVPIE